MLRPSQFLKRADGTRFVVDAAGVVANVFSVRGAIVAACHDLDTAVMVRNALEFQARDGETFSMEDKGE